MSKLTLVHILKVKVKEYTCICHFLLTVQAFGRDSDSHHFVVSASVSQDPPRSTGV